MFKEFLEELKYKEISISFSAGKLKYSGPEENIDSALIAKLKEHKPKLIKHFWPEDCPNMLPLNTEGNLTAFSLLHGGSFFELSEYLGSNRPMYSFLFIGSESEKDRYKKLEDFASVYLKQLQNIIPNGPYLLGGMSMGGHLAFEMALQLQRQGKDVPLLILVDSGLTAFEPPVKYNSVLKSLFHKIYNYLRKTKIKINRLKKKAKYELFPSQFEKLPIGERTEYIVSLYDQLINNYKPEEEYKGEILLFRASENSFNSKYLGWDKVCKNVNVVNFIGNHASMFHDVEAIELIKYNISEWIDKTENRL
ncbi:thioesterase domain-containing protein [Saccharicrinis sp. GN24d3]|uniref:thioesterase domain-containing protein n=1 Tax=Saccharicrinis sp. GN24d3 TaxID=3458416 RepID=UPI0040357316